MTSQNAIIRAATVKDAEAVWKIYQAANGEPATRDDDYWERLIRQGGMLIATLEGTSIGFGGIDIHATEQIRYVYVLPEYQRSDARFGSQILDALEAVAWQAGIRLIRLHSTTNAVRFYEKAGYSAVERKAMIGHDHPGVEMAKELGVRRQ